MKIIRSMVATVITDAIIIGLLWKLGTFPVFLLMIDVGKYGYTTLIVMFSLLTWSLTVLWLWFFNRRKKHA